VARRKSKDIYGGKDPRELPSYSVPEAAHQLRMPVTTLRYWVTSAKEPLIAPARSHPLTLSFWNLVEAQVLASIRRQHEVSMPRVRRAMDYVKERLQLERPLIHQEFETDGVDLFVREYGKNGGEQLVVASEGGQLAMDEVLRGVLKRVERDEKDGLVLRLHPYFKNTDEPLHVVVDPRRGYGRPCVSATGIPIDVLAERFAGGDTIDALANDYRLERSVVEYALQWSAAVQRGPGARSA